MLVEIIFNNTIRVRKTMLITISMEEIDVSSERIGLLDGGREMIEGYEVVEIDIGNAMFHPPSIKAQGSTPSGTQPTRCDARTRTIGFDATDQTIASPARGTHRPRRNVSAITPPEGTNAESAMV
jgi:hypothetical protein